MMADVELPSRSGGNRVFPAASCWKMMASLGMSGQTRKRAVSAMTVAAERASSWLWLRREDGSWKPDRRGSRLITFCCPAIPGMSRVRG